MRSKNMASEKALYWMAVGLLALVAGNHLANRFDVRSIADRSMAAVEELAAPPAHAFATVVSWMGHGSSQCARGQAAMARAQAHFASIQTTIARQDVACARRQAENARVAVHRMQQMRLNVVVPAESISVEIPEVEIPQINAPQVQLVSSDSDDEI
jgi:hypothetical protein